MSAPEQYEVRAGEPLVMVSIPEWRFDQLQRTEKAFRELLKDFEQEARMRGRSDLVEDFLRRYGITGHQA